MKNSNPYRRFAFAALAAAQLTVPIGAQAEPGGAPAGLTAQSAPDNDRNSYILMGDPDHTNNAQFDFLKRQIGQLSADGVDRLFLELPPEVQPMLDRMANEEISRSNFKYWLDQTDFRFGTDDEKLVDQRWDLIADILVTAKKAGIQVWAADILLQNVSPELQRAFEAEKFYAECRQIALDTFKIENDQRIAKLNTETDPKKGEAILAGLNEEFESGFATRFPELAKEHVIDEKALTDFRSDDREFVKFIRGHKGKRKAAILVGAFHLRNLGENGITHLLGKSISYKIESYIDVGEAAVFFRMACKTNESDLPDNLAVKTPENTWDVLPTPKCPKPSNLWQRIFSAFHS